MKKFRTVASVIIMVIAGIVGFFIGAFLNEPMAGTILFSMIAGIACIVYAIDNHEEQGKFQFDEIKKLLERENMVGRIYHVGLTVSDLDRSIAFYRDILRLEFQGEIFMEGEATDKMFRKENCKARVAYLNGSKALEAPPVELIQFVDSKIHKEQSDLFTTSISEVCFYTDNIDSVYKTFIENHVECLSEPQYFDFRADGFGESRAFYFRDPDGIILEMMQPL